MSSLWSLARRYGFDAFILIAALGSALTVALAGHSADAPRTTHWFAVPATAIVMLPLLGRRRFPFGAPLSVWLPRRQRDGAPGRRRQAQAPR